MGKAAVNPRLLPAWWPSAALQGLQWAGADHRGQLSGQAKQLGQRTVTVVVVAHLILTCLSPRYRSTDWADGFFETTGISPSWALASLLLLLFPTSLFSSRQDGGITVEGCDPAGRRGLMCHRVEETEQQENEDAHSIQADSLSRAASSNASQRGAGLGRQGIFRRLAKRLFKGMPASAAGQGGSQAEGRALHFELPFGRRRSFGGSRSGRASSETQRGSDAPDSQAAALGRPLRKQTSGNYSQGRWQPSMARIASGQHLNALQDAAECQSASSTATSAPSSKARGGVAQGRGATEVLTVPHSGHLAVDCMSQDATDPLMAEVANVVTREHLLQFGALLGESSAELALSQAGLPPAIGGGSDSLLGDTDDPHRAGWELAVEEHCARRGLHYWGWRHYLRRGLFMYRTRQVFEGVTPEQLTAFMLDSDFKKGWDDTCADLRPIPPPCCLATPGASPASSMGGAASSGGADPGQAPVMMGPGELEQRVRGQSSFMYARSRFPAPMAQREYVYARRVWAKADDGGCYVVQRCGPHPGPPLVGGRAVKVEDFVCAFVIRAADSEAAPGKPPAAEFVSIYFEDSKVNPGIMNLGVRKGLWPSAQKMEVQLRKYVTIPRGKEEIEAVSAVLRAGPGQAAARLALGCSSAAPAGGNSSCAAEPAGAASSYGGGKGSGSSKLGKVQELGQAACSRLSKEARALLGAAASFVVVTGRALLWGHRAIASLFMGAVSLAYRGGLRRPRLASGSGALEGQTEQQQQEAGGAAATISWRARLYAFLQRAEAEASAADKQKGSSGSADGDAGSTGSSRGSAGEPPSPRHLASHPICMRNTTSSCGAAGPPSPTGAAAGQGPAWNSGVPGARRAAARRLGRRMVTRVAAVAVRAVGLPLIHKVLLSNSAPSPSPSSGSLQGLQSSGGAQGRAGGAQQQAPQQQSGRGSSAGSRGLRHSLSGPAVSDADPFLLMHHDTMNLHHMALSQMKQRGQGQGTDGGAGGSRKGQQQGSQQQQPPVHRAKSLGRLVVEGVVLWGKDNYSPVSP